MRTVSVIAASLLLVACGGDSENDENANLWQVSVARSSTAPLTQVSGQPLASYLKNGLYAQTAVSGSTAAPPAAPPPPPPPAVSVTNLVTEGVDEADRVKFAEQTLYVSGLTPDTYLPYLKRWQRNDDSSLTALDDLELPPELGRVHGLYASGNRLIVVGGESYHGIGFNFPPSGLEKISPAVFVQLFEQGNNVYQLQFDGELLDSRRTVDALWLVSRYKPEVEGLKHYAATVADKQHNIQLLESTRLSELMPKRQLNNTAAEPLIASQQCYLPADRQANEGNSRMVVVTRIATSAPYQTESSCIITPVTDMYMSAEHLYLHGGVYSATEEKTVLHKFSLDDAAAGYQATGAVDGYIQGSQTAFMLHEKQQYLMLLTTSWGNNGPLNQFWVMQQQGNSLQTVAKLPSAQQPEQVIGKPGEAIYGVRFVGERAYVVTFERTDPLYTLDISNPMQPAIIGELEIPGYSAYLHSINNNLLWGLGQQIEMDSAGNPLWDTAGAKIALFDVAADDAVVQQELLFNAQFSPLEHQHHSLATVQHGSITRMALPLSRYSAEYGGQISLLTLQVDSNGTMDKTGELIPEHSEYYSSWDARSVLVNDDIYFIVDDKVYQSNWQLPEQVIGQY
ncbi:beta-propeller domain-containing protein [Arsukibacterium perlucidum]|uniref:beta-propeller domain-containing protein n=1 Tax=Arsukibacterium perlucidum TaxID=368811 RepID=UPI000527BC64|nr:beta-propeller domain-containing protein [Arsukibacterium perlucidum]